MPLLHRWDDCTPTDTNVNLWVCWLKAIAGNRRRGGYADGGLAYDLLPPVTRRVVARPLARLFPRLHHQNVAMRTAYLDQVLEAELQAAAEVDAATAVVILGAGFDARALRLDSPANLTISWAEVDLPHVMAQKQRLLGRLRQRRPQLAPRIERLRQLPANLSVADETRAALRDALAPPAAGDPHSRALFVFEALLIYIRPENAAELLRLCVEEAEAAGYDSACVCFADRLPDVPGCAFETARAALLAQARLELEEDTWLPKPGLARHMGVARWQRRE